MPTVPWRKLLTPEPDVEYVVMASRLPLRSITKVPWFMTLALSVARQLERTEGVVGYTLRAQPLARTFWTLSAWTDEPSLGAFVRELPHRAVMAKLRPHMDATTFTFWTSAGSELPIAWTGAVERLARQAEAASGAR
jgi:hypothetical protein